MLAPVQQPAAQSLSRRRGAGDGLPRSPARGLPPAATSLGVCLRHAPALGLFPEGGLPHGVAPLDRLLEAAVVEDAGDAVHRHSILAIGILAHLLGAASFEDVQVKVPLTAT